MLVATLDQLDDLPKLMDKMLKSWMGGTPDPMGDVFLTGMGNFEAAFLARLLYARHRHWIAPLEALLDRNRESLELVGAAHLIGEDSVLALLEEAGYEIERIQ